LKNLHAAAGVSEDFIKEDQIKCKKDNSKDIVKLSGTNNVFLCCFCECQRQIYQTKWKK